MSSRLDDGWTQEQIDQRAEGYECQDCGYTPTFYELDQGFCPRCPRKKEVPTKEEDKVP